MGMENCAKYLQFQLIKSKARKVELASIGKDARANMIKITEKFKEMIEGNNKYRRYGVRIKPVKDVVTDVEDKKNPD